MDSLSKDLAEALDFIDRKAASHGGDNTPVDKNQDGFFENGSGSWPSSTDNNIGRHLHNSTLASSTTPVPSLEEDSATLVNKYFPLPVEIMLDVLDYLTVPELIPSQSVSRQFRAMSRTVLLDKLGGRFLQSLQRQRDCTECKVLQEQQAQIRQRGQSLPRSASIGGGDMHGLPPLPNHHQSTNTETIMNQSQHQASHHLYQHQSMEDLGQHYQTDLHIFHRNHSYNIPSTAPSSASSSSSIPAPESQQSHQYQSLFHGQPRSYHHDPDFIAPGTVALFLFPHHDHTPTGWQDRQSVHFQCSGIDREREQLIFTPIIRENDCLKFNTNSWNLPSAPTAMTLPPLLTRSINSFSAVAAAAASMASGSETGLNLFEYSTGRSTSGRVGQPDNISNSSVMGTSSYTFANQFSSSLGSSAHSRSPSVESTSSSTSTTISSPSLSSSNSSSSSTFSPPWSSVSGHGSDNYSVIGIRHGDWPEDRPTAGRWWGGGLNTNMTQESMVFLPWAAGPGGPGSVADYRQWLLKRRDQQQQQTRGLKVGEDMEDVSPKSKDDHGNCSSRVHKHRMYQLTSRAHNPPAHHHRFLCLHHDQLMTDMAAYSSASLAASSAMADNAELHKVKNDSHRKPLAPLISRAGSKYLSIDYGAKVMESKRCLFCLSSPCKANLEIQIKFDQVRISLDWILSGF